MQKSLVKALQILELLSNGQKDYGISEIADSLDLYKSNVHQILNTFEQFNYVRKDPSNHRYSLSVHFLEIAHRISSRITNQEFIRDRLQALTDELGEITYYGVPDGSKVMYFSGAFPMSSVSNQSVLGMTAPLVCTGIGKAILAYMPEEQIDELLSKPLEKFTDNTITDPDKLREELKKIRNNGYSVDNMEHEYGVKCVAVPVLNHLGQVQGAVSITGPSLRFPASSYKKYASKLQNVAVQIGQSIL